MAEDTLPCRFLRQPAAYLICPFCRNILTSPIISNCGHTFCRSCFSRACNDTGGTQCPVDGSTCSASVIVVNRALEDQIGDLEIYCMHGLSWSDSDEEYVQDPSGCPLTVKLGQRAEHENVCDFAVITCPYGGIGCGQFRRRELPSHLAVCLFIPCANSNKGCEFVGSQEAVHIHLSTCGYRGLQLLAGNMINGPGFEDLKEKNAALQDKVKTLEERVAELEKSRDEVTAQYTQTMSLLEQVQKHQQEMTQKLEKYFRRRPASSVSSYSIGGAARRTGSTSSVSSNSPPCTRTENWMMPFHFKCIGTLRGHNDSVNCMQLIGSLLFSSGSDMKIKMWNLEQLAKGCQMTLTGHTESVLCIASDDTKLFTGGDDLSIRSWNIEEETMDNIIENVNDDPVVTMVCSDDFLFSSSKNAIKVWKLATMELLHTITGLHHRVRALALSYGQDRLYSGSHNAIEIWDAVSPFSLKAKIDHQFGSIYSLAVTSQYIIAGTYNRNIQIYDVTSLNHVETRLSAHIGTINALQVSPSGRYLFSGSSDSTIKIWNLENFLPIQTLSRHADSVNALALHGDLLLSASSDHEIKVFKHFSLA